MIASYTKLRLDFTDIKASLVLSVSVEIRSVSCYGACVLQVFDEYIDRINLILMTKSTATDKLMRKIAKIRQQPNATE